MGNHGGVNAGLRASDVNRGARTSTAFKLLSSQAFTLRNWPVSWRLFAVFILTLAMGLVFGGLRVAARGRQCSPIQPRVAARQPRTAGHQLDAGLGGRT